MNKRNFYVIGLGKFGTALALSLMEHECQVTVIDYDANTVNSISDKVTNAIIGDPTNESTLKSSGVSEADCAVVCMASSMNDSILTVLILKELGVGNVVARAMSERHRTVLEKIGADHIVSPERDMGEKLASILSRRGLLDYIEFSDAYSIAEIVVPERWIGKSIAENNIRRKHNVTVIAVRRSDGKVFVSPDPTLVFNKGDTMSVVGDSANVDKLAI